MQQIYRKTQCDFNKFALELWCDMVSTYGTMCGTYGICCQVWYDMLSTYGTKNSGVDQVKFVEDSL